MLGILIGAASIVAMLTIGHMAQLETLKLFKHMGVDIVQIHAMPTGGGPGIIERPKIEALAGSDPSVLIAAPLALDRATIVSGGQTSDQGVLGVTGDLQGLAGLVPAVGRFIAPSDDDNLVAVVGAETAQKLSLPGAPLGPGARIRVRGYVYTVVGVLAPTSYTALDPTDFNNAVMTPLTGIGRIMAPADPGTALIRLRPGVEVKAVSARLVKALTNPFVTLQVLNAQDMIRTMNAQKAIHSQLLTAVGAISLLVGGIGVMNVMLMGVMERRSEIGLRAAIGASPRDLQIMFLVEAGALAFAGGVAGLLLGLGAAFAIAMASHWSFSLPLYVLPLGPGLACVVGLIFGLYPAVKASRLDPIEALRAE
ncbi:MAG: ABC transporter permease [Caulobacteraceae bacterium]|nr:ABC transporter permease [Caulobacteraceae bacterium]